MTEKLQKSDICQKSPAMFAPRDLLKARLSKNLFHFILSKIKCIDLLRSAAVNETLKVCAKDSSM